MWELKHISQADHLTELMKAHVWAGVLVKDVSNWSCLSVYYYSNVKNVDQFKYMY